MAIRNKRNRAVVERLVLGAWDALKSYQSPTIKAAHNYLSIPRLGSHQRRAGSHQRQVGSDKFDMEVRHGHWFTVQARTLSFRQLSVLQSRCE